MAFAAAPAAADAGVSPASDLRAFCAVPESLSPSVFLKHTRAAYRAGKPLRVVVLGTSSSAGTGGPGRGEPYPARLQTDLQRRFALPVEVVNKSLPGQTARQMAARLEDDAASRSPSLVIWQTGTVDASAHAEVDDFGRALSQGIEILDKEGIDVILMNMQYSRRIELLVNYGPYVEMMKAAASQSDALLFDRLEMMRHWAAEGRLDFDDMPRSERASRAVKLHECLALQLGDMIEKAVRR
ncbi:MAG: SGNH/GDSL hydrolase family protein [Alphaproteobacteria bacterium]